MTDPFAPIRALARTASSDALSAFNAARVASESIDRVTTAALALVLPALGFTVIDADNTGASDVTDAINAQIAARTGSMVYLGPGTYLVDPAKKIRLVDGLVLVMHPDAILKAIPRAGDRLYVLWGQAVSDVLVIGGQIEGERIDHTYTAGKTDEHNHGVMLERCTRVQIRDLRVRFCGGDGLSVSGEAIYLIDVDSQFNRRQALTIGGSKHVRVIRGVYSNTGRMPGGTSAGYLGTKPMAGIDCEPDATDIEDIVIDGAEVSRNGSTGVLAWSRSGTGVSGDVTVINCTLDSNPNALQAKGLGGPIVLVANRNTIINSSGSGVRIEDNATGYVGTKDPADANVFDAPAARVAFDLTGRNAKTANDMRTIDSDDAAHLVGGVIAAGFNHFR